MKKRRKIALVTGGAGFIGSHMVDLLLSKGFSVRIIDNLTGGHKKNLKHCIKNKKIKFKNFDICKLQTSMIIFLDKSIMFFILPESET